MADERVFNEDGISYAHAHKDSLICEPLFYALGNMIEIELSGLGAPKNMCYIPIALIELSSWEHAASHGSRLFNTPKGFNFKLVNP